MSCKKCFLPLVSLGLCSRAWLMFKEAPDYWNNTETSLTFWNSTVSCWFTISQKPRHIVNSLHHHDFCPSRPVCGIKKQTGLTFTVLPVWHPILASGGKRRDPSPCLPGAMRQGQVCSTQPGEVQTPGHPIPVTSERNLQTWLQRVREPLKYV